MKILVLCYEYPPVGGGGGRVAAAIASEMVGRGHSVRVQTAGMQHLPPHETVDGIEIFRAESFRKREDTCSVPEMAAYLGTSLIPALGLARNWRPDVIHAHFAVPTGALAMVLGATLRIPYVLTAHLGDVPGGVPEQTAGLFRMVSPFARHIWKRAAAVTAVSSHVARLSREAYDIQPFVILNGRRPLQPPTPTPVVNSPRRIVMTGRLSIQKNPIFAIEALAKIPDIDWRLDIIGDGPLRDAMADAARRAGLFERCIFHGWLRGTEVAAIMREADVLLMPSLHEGMPMAAVEALQHGLAIAASDIGGMFDVVQDGATGFLAPLDIAQFAQKLRTLLENPERLLRARMASLAKAGEFDLDRSAGEYERVLASVAKT